MHAFKKDFRDTIRLAVPVIIGQVGHMMMGVVDSLMVGQIGATPLAASAIGHSLFILFLIFGIGVSLAISPLVAMLMGAGKQEETGLIFRHGMLVNLILGIILSFGTYFGADILLYLNQPQDVVGQAIIYMQILAFSIIPVMIFQTYRQYIEGMSVMKPAMVVTLLANIVNVFVNWVLIFGNLGAPAMGLAGAGWATFSTRTLMALSLALYVSLNIKFKACDTSLRFKTFDRDVIRKILKIGVPGGVQYLFEVGAFTAATVIIGWLGTTQLAAHQIVYQSCLNLVYVCAGNLFCSSYQGRQCGWPWRYTGYPYRRFERNNISRCGHGQFRDHIYRPALSVTGHIYSGSGGDQCGRDITDNRGPFPLSDGTQAVGIGALRGIADTRVPMIITFIAYWVIGIPVGCLLAFVFDYGVQGIWVGLLGALTASAIMLTWRFQIKSRQPVRV